MLSIVLQELFHIPNAHSKQTESFSIFLNIGRKK